VFDLFAARAEMMSVSDTKKTIFSQSVYFSPLPLDTGESPVDMLNIIWRKNDVFLDVGNYSLGSFIMIAWPLILLFLLIGYIMPDPLLMLSGFVVVGCPVLCFIHSLFQAAPLPIRFNRQRREVCIPKGKDEYWLVPWESVVAASVQGFSISQAGKMTQGLLIVTFKKNRAEVGEEDAFYSWGFNCGGGVAAMQLWECMRSYMEIGPHAVTDNTARFYRPKGILASYAEDVVEAAQRKGWFMAVLWEGFFGLFIFNTLLIDVLERMKLSPSPDLPYPEIIEWSKPLPPDQWTKRSPELEVAIAQREAELGIRSS